MNACFKTIVVAVDFSANTDAAIRKALEFSSSGSVLHLVYVQNQLAVLPVFPPALLLQAMGFFKRQNLTGRTKLRNLRKQILQERPNAQVRLMIVRAGLVKKVILNKAREEKADLIIIGKSHRMNWRSFLTPSLSTQLVKEAPCAVLTVTASASEHAIETVVMPVIEKVTYNTMGVVAALSKKHPLRIHLVTFTEERQVTEGAPSTLLRVYQWLKTSLQCQVQCKVLSTPKKMDTMLAYAETVHADMILLDPELQVKNRWWRKHGTAVLQLKSNVSLLALRPAGSFAIE